MIQLEKCLALTWSVWAAPPLLRWPTSWHHTLQSSCPDAAPWKNWVLCHHAFAKSHAFLQVIHCIYFHLQGSHSWICLHISPKTTWELRFLALYLLYYCCESKLESKLEQMLIKSVVCICHWWDRTERYYRCCTYLYIWLLCIIFIF